MTTSTPAAVTGPLALAVDGFRQELERLGYGPRSRRRQECLLADLSVWMDERGVQPGALTSRAIAAYLEERRRSGLRLVTQTGARSLLQYLRLGGVIPDAYRDAPAGPLGALLGRYHAYLTNERGLNAGTIANYDRTAERFIRAIGATDEIGLASLTAADVSRFLIGAARMKEAASLREIVSNLRSFLRYLHVAGLIDTPLAQAVPGHRSWRGGQVPKWLAPDDVSRMLQGCDRATTRGQRDHAILMLLARLGLRAGEVSAMTLDDIDWRAGDVVIRGKGPRMDRLPLPSDVGAALAAYLRDGRSTVDDRRLFITTKAPIGGMSRASVTEIVSRAAARVGLFGVGPHRLRHSAATSMLRSGASLPEIGQVLRHRHVDTTAVYAKVDQPALSLVARPWPGASK